MLVITNQIVYGPGRFVAAGSEVDLPDREAHQLVSENKATYVHPPFGRPPAEETRLQEIETAARSSGACNAMKPIPRPKPQGKP